MWKGWFPSQDLVKFEEEEYPILIGVMIFPEDPGMNQYEILLCDDVLVWTNKELDLDCLLWDLIAFREEFQQNSYPVSVCVFHNFIILFELFQLSQFVQKIVSCTELVLTICEYLSTNDAIATFSPDVLPLIFNNHKIFPLINPSRAFLLRMARTNNLEKMPHLSLSVDQLKLDSTTHERIIPWSVNPNLMLYSLNEPYFVNLTYLTISYAGQIEFIKLCRIFKIIPSCIKHLRLKFNSMECFNCSLKIVCVEQIPFNNGIETFELYLNSLSWSSWNNHCQESDRCLLNGLVELIAWMHHIQKIHLFLKEHIERLLYPAEWTSLLDRCRQLSEIKLQGKHNIESEMEFLNKVHNVTDELQHTRESMTFQVCVK